jgi:hypothetical protein
MFKGKDNKPCEGLPFLEREKLSNACPNVVDWFENFTDSFTNSSPSTDITK